MSYLCITMKNSKLTSEQKAAAEQKRMEQIAAIAPMYAHHNYTTARCERINHLIDNNIR